MGTFPPRHARPPAAALALLLAALPPAPQARAAEAGPEPALAAARRYLDSWGEDGEALAAFRRTGDGEARRALRTACREGRRFAPAPTGVLHGTAPLPHDSGFRVSYTLWVPPSYDPARAHPLLLYVHGTHSCGDDALRRVLPAFRDKNVLVLCPSSEIRDRGWTSTAYERRMQLAALRAVRRRYRTDPARIMVGGYSRGGHASWALPLRYPGLFCAAFPLAGGPRLRGIRFADNLLHTALHAEWGDRDEEGLVWCLRRARERLADLGYGAACVERAGDGHVFLPDYAALADWALETRRPALPRRAVFVADEAGDHRAFWLRLLRVDRKARLPAAGRGTLVLGGRERTVTIRGVPTPRGFDEKPREERWDYFERKARDYRAVLRARVEEGNVVRAETQKVESFEVWIAEGLFDLAQPVEVYTNGRRALRRRVRPDPAWALEQLGPSEDLSVIYWAALRVRVREGR